MKYLLMLILLLATYQEMAAQADLEKKARQIEREGMQLYLRERASWHGTDLFLEKHRDMSDIGGYFSYVKDGRPTCIFFSKELTPKVIGTMTFDTSYNLDEATTDLSVRRFTPMEEELYQLRKLSAERLESDTTIRYYQNTQLNAIPIISEGVKKVYVITGTSQQGVVPLGNDYLITFSNDYKVRSVEPLHRTLLLLPMHPKDSTGEEQKGMGGVHTHLPGFNPFITPTDICTLLQYERFTHWGQHIVVSKDYVTIWIAAANKMIITKREAFEKATKSAYGKDK